jgi:hypothetical protein
MPRPKRLNEVIRRGIFFPIDILAILETLFYDPVNERAKYGALSEYIVGLIRKDLRERGLLR